MPMEIELVLWIMLNYSFQTKVNETLNFIKMNNVGKLIFNLCVFARPNVCLKITI